MARDAEQRDGDGEAVNGEEEELYGNDGVDEAGEDSSGSHSVLLHQLGEVVESARCKDQGGSVRSWNERVLSDRRINLPMARVRKEKPMARPR